MDIPDRLHPKRAWHKKAHNNMFGDIPKLDNKRTENWIKNPRKVIVCKDLTTLHFKNVCKSKLKFTDIDPDNREKLAGDRSNSRQAIRVGSKRGDDDDNRSFQTENRKWCKDGTLVECSIHLLRGSRVTLLLVIDKVQSWINTNVAYKRFQFHVFVVCVFIRLMLQHKAGINSWWYKT